MSGAELKTDAHQRWMMHSKDAYGSGRIFLTAEQKQAVDEGKKFAQRAYADVWARDAEMVKRVRTFLGAHFHWHDRLAKNGADLEVIETLQSMIRGESVVLIAEQTRSGGSTAAVTPALPAIPSFRETLMTEYAMSYDAATDYIERHNAMVDRVNAVSAQSASKAASSLADDTDDLTDTATPLGDAQPFVYTPDAVSGDTFELAKTPNEGEPGTWYTNPGSRQMRLFGDDGQRVVDFDFDHDHGQGVPHAHNWALDPLSGKLGRGPGLPFSLLP